MLYKCRPTLWYNFTGPRWIPRTNGQLRGKCFHLMKSSWVSFGPVYCLSHDDVIKWKHFPRYWPCVRDIQWWPVVPLAKASDAEFWCFLDVRLNRLLIKQSTCWSFEMALDSLWRHCIGRTGEKSLHWAMITNVCDVIFSDVIYGFTGNSMYLSIKQVSYVWSHNSLR